jgi:hypothetical protein
MARQKDRARALAKAKNLVADADPYTSKPVGVLTPADTPLLADRLADGAGYAVDKLVEVVLMPCDPKNEKLLALQVSSATTLVNLKSRVDETSFLAKEPKKEKKDIHAILAQIRRDNPQLYQSSDIATLEASFEELLETGVGAPGLPDFSEGEPLAQTPVKRGSEEDYGEPTPAPAPDFAGRVALSCAARMRSQGHDPEPWRPHSAHPRANRTGPTNGFCADPRLPARRS